MASDLLKSSNSIFFSESSIFWVCPITHENKKLSSSPTLNSFLFSKSINFKESPNVLSLLLSPLKDKSTEIDFSLATEGVVEVDVNKNESPKYRRLNETENAYFKEMFKSLPPESRVKNCKYLIKRQKTRL